MSETTETDVQHPAGTVPVSLRCVDETAAAACAQFLVGKDITWTRAVGSVVETALRPAAVIYLAEDAFEEGWADDSECAAIIAKMSDAVDEARRPAPGAE